MPMAAGGERLLQMVAGTLHHGWVAVEWVILVLFGIG
jgi:hypothetical protein